MKLKIEFADLGDWGSAELRSEYDPEGPVIRINTRVLDRLPAGERNAFVAQAIAHEFGHHLEHCEAATSSFDRLRMTSR